MINFEQRSAKERQKEKVRRRIHVTVDPENYEYIPAKKPVDFYDNETYQRVAVYVRVSTDDIRQTTSYELQQQYYEDFVNKHPNWDLVGIYADEGISGTSLKHRDAFNRMIQDAKDGKLDLIVTKSVSRFARNVLITIGVVRELSSLKNPVGVFFESECIFSMNDDSQMALSFVASMAQEESHIRSRSMDSSIRMRLDHGIPLTPKLLGYMHNEDGELIVNPEEAPTVKLIFYMYLYGYSTAQIAEAMQKLGKRTYLGNFKWTPGTIITILRNERHCGDVLTQKTITESYLTHRTLKNRGEKPQSRYIHHHEGIISRDDFIAVQHMIDNARYRNRELLPKLHVIDDGALKGYVVINPRWAAFKSDAYAQASKSVTGSSDDTADRALSDTDQQYESTDGEFDLRGFEVVRSELLDVNMMPTAKFGNKTVRFNTVCAKKFSAKKAEILIHPGGKKIAIRPAPDDSRNGVLIALPGDTGYVSREIPAAAFVYTIFDIFGWKRDYTYKITGTLYENGAEFAYIFSAEEPEIFLNKKRIVLTGSEDGAVSTPILQSRQYVQAVPETWADTFGREYYSHMRTFAQIASQSEADWNLYLKGQLFHSGEALHVTDFQELRRYIQQELKDIRLEDGLDA